MNRYPAMWTPDTFARAQYMIDTGRDAEDFWRVGRDEAARIMRRWSKPHEVVLDYGCGVGRMLRCMSARTRIGVDASPDMLAYARESAPECEWILTPGDVIPLADRSVDFTYSLLALQHLDADDAAAILGEVRRVLRPGGEYLLSFSAFGARWSPGAVLTHWSATFAYTPEILRTLCRAAGLLGHLETYGPKEAGYWEVTNMRLEK